MPKVPEIIPPAIVRAIILENYRNIPFHSALQKLLLSWHKKSDLSLSEEVIFMVWAEEVFRFIIGGQILELFAL